jgi:hypothetical protein
MAGLPQRVRFAPRRVPRATRPAAPPQRHRRASERGLAHIQTFKHSTFRPVAANLSAGHRAKGCAFECVAPCCLIARPRAARRASSTSAVPRALHHCRGVSHRGAVLTRPPPRRAAHRTLQPPARARHRRPAHPPRGGPRPPRRAVLHHVSHHGARCCGAGHRPRAHGARRRPAAGGGAGVGRRGRGRGALRRRWARPVRAVGAADRPPGHRRRPAGRRACLPMLLQPGASGGGAGGRARGGAPDDVRRHLRHARPRGGGAAG